LNRSETPPGAPATPIGADPEERLDLLLRHLGTGTEGLSTPEAERRLEQHGPNEIRRHRGPSRLRELARQFTHPLALLLWAAAALALVAGIPALAVAIVVVIVLNALFAFAQEVQAERATEALREFLPPRVRVKRDGSEAEVDATSLVPGDLLLLNEGDRLSADARLIDGSLEVDMSPLTGESAPVGRSAHHSGPPGPPLESDDLVFSGTLCTAGAAKAIVYSTGMATQLGRIAALSQRVQAEISPLQVQVNQAARLIAVIAVSAGVLFLFLGTLVAGLNLSDSLTFAIGLLVANVPEGLLPTITLALAVGVRRMARRRALVKRLTAVETLGSTDVICTDKTGTLTTGKMVVRAFWGDGRELEPGAGASGAEAREPFSGLLRTAVRCCNAHAERNESGWQRAGDPTESALLVAAGELWEDVAVAQRDRERRRVGGFPFDARVKRMTTIDVEGEGEGEDEHWLHAKGAPLELLERCGSIRGPDGDRPLSPGDRSMVREAFEAYAARGLRVLGFAEQRLQSVPKVEDRERVEDRLTFLGLAALEDPPRPEVAGAVAQCRLSGVRVIVVTGDHGLTAEAVARGVGIVGEEPTVVSGQEIEALPVAELNRLLDESAELIIARSNPETKLHLVDALREQGHTVAMTGDGVNDAPALRRADIGVSMGLSGTDVAREASTMVLADDNFASIVSAIREGRVVYENIRKFITYIFAHATPEVVPFLLFALSGGSIPLGITALQILAIDLGTETLPALALGQEPPEPGVMDKPPRKRDENIITGSMLTRAWLRLGLLEALLVTGAFLLVLVEAGWSPGDPTGTGSALHEDYLLATTVVFAGITTCQVGTAFATRTSHESLRRIGVFTNRMLLWGIAFELAFAAAIVYVPWLQDIFGTAALGVREIAVLATFPLVVWGSDELWRWRRRRRGAAAR